MKDPLTVLHGLMKRVMIKPSPYEPKLLLQLKNFVETITPLLLNPLSPLSNTAFYAWLNKTPYPKWRKDQLTEVFLSMNSTVTSKDFSVGGFIKDETYPEYKHARGINARNDKAKVLLGPIFKLIEEQVFKLPFFIKKIPKRKRARHLMKYLYRANARYAVTDFTSFEAHFTTLIMEILERPLYHYMTQYLDQHQEFMSYYDEFILGINSIRFSYFTVNIEGTRMTGEMNTSLGNGWSNLMLYLFTLHCSGYDLKDLLTIPLRVEGDDGICTLDNDKLIRKDIFEKLGFSVKLEIVDNIEEASFCGNVFDPQDMIIIPNIIETLADFGWGNSKYARSRSSKLHGLLKAKAYSLLYEYPGCPLLQSLAHRIIYLLRNVRHIHDSTFNYYKHHHQTMLQQAIQKWNNTELPFIDTPLRTRFLVEKLYNIPVNIQLILEQYFMNITDLKELNHPLLTMLIPDLWLKNSQQYVQTINVSHTRINSWPTLEFNFRLSSTMIDEVRTHYNIS